MSISYSSQRASVLPCCSMTRLHSRRFLTSLVRDRLAASATALLVCCLIRYFSSRRSARRSLAAATARTPPPTTPPSGKISHQKWKRFSTQARMPPSGKCVEDQPGVPRRALVAEGALAHLVHHVRGRCAPLRVDQHH